MTAYALIGEKHGFTPVSGLALIYMEPVTEEGTARADGIVSKEGFRMGFSAHVLPVTLNTDIIRPLLATVRKLSDMATTPAGRKGCKDCLQVNTLLGEISRPLNTGARP